MTTRPCCGETGVIELTPEEQEQQLEFDFLIDKETNSKKRMDICKECPSLGALNMCKECKCFMDIKTRIYKSSCPLGKW